MKSTFLLLLSLLVALCTFSSHADETNAVTPEAVTNSMGLISATIEMRESPVTGKTLFSNMIPVLSKYAPKLMGTNYDPVEAKGLIGAFTNSALPEIHAATKFLTDLKEDGRLPGVSKDSHGDATTGELPLDELQEARYPFAVTFYFVLSGDSFTNIYTVLRPSKDAAWRLDKAWRVDTEGRIVIEWPIK
jgi:hypothetical protein